MWSSYFFKVKLAEIPDINLQRKCVKFQEIQVTQFRLSFLGFKLCANMSQKIEKVEAYAKLNNCIVYNWNIFLIENRTSDLNECTCTCNLCSKTFKIRISVPQIKKNILQVLWLIPRSNSKIQLQFKITTSTRNFSVFYGDFIYKLKKINGNINFFMLSLLTYSTALCKLGD